MKKLLLLILCCLLLSGCGEGLEEPVTESEAAVFDLSALPGDLTGPPILSPDGRTLFYCTPARLLAWDLSSGLHRVVKEMEGQVLTDVLLEGTVLQCTAGEETFFLSAQDGSLLYRGRGDYQIRTEGNRYWAVLPNDLTLWGTTDGEPMLLTAQRASLPYFHQDLTALSREAQRLGQVYGITILMGDEAAPDSAWTPELLEPVLRQALTTLEQALSHYPPSVLQQTAAHFAGLNLCLVEHIAEAEEGQLFLDGAVFLALPIGPDLEKSLHHSLFHIMETHIFAESNAFDQWETLNPSGFQYDYDFAANSSRKSGVYLFESHRSFVDTYSMSYPREDRARIFEQAMLPGQEALFQPPAMQKKLQTLCNGIRKAFALEGAEESFLWEQYLE